MNHRDAFLQAILAQPADPAPRLVYADWLEEQGDPRAELFRLQHALTQQIEFPGRRELESRRVSGSIASAFDWLSLAGVSKVFSEAFAVERKASIMRLED